MKDTSEGYKGIGRWPHGLSNIVLGPRSGFRAQR